VSARPSVVPVSGGGGGALVAPEAARFGAAAVCEGLVASGEGTDEATTQIRGVLPLSMPPVVRACSTVERH
jgi:hypothetical protein